MKQAWFAAVGTAALLGGCATTAGGAGGAYDLLITDAVVYDGSGGQPYRGEVAVRGDRIAYVGPTRPAARHAS
jgi:N-acyl-D-amino-acid deacylase